MADLTKEILPRLRRQGKYEYPDLIRELDEAKQILKDTFARLDTLYVTAGALAPYYTKGESDSKYYAKVASDARYYTKAEIDTAFTALSNSIAVSYAPIVHDHDSRYFTEAEVTTFVNNLTTNINNRMPIAGGNFTGPITIQGSINWHAGNDGAASGLDADLLDGEHGERFLPIVASTAGVLSWDDATNTRAGIGSTLLLGTATNGPGGSEYFYPYTLWYSGGAAKTQYAMPYYGARAQFYRNLYAGVWSAWTRVIDSARPIFSGEGTGVPYNASVARNFIASIFSVNQGFTSYTGGVLTVSQAGIYEIVFKALSENGYAEHTQLFKNATQIDYSHHNVTTYNMSMIHWIGPAVAGDAFKLVVPAGYGIYTGSTQYNRFSAQLIA